MALISLKEVCFGFGGPPLLDSIDLQIEPGQRIGLLGRNGVGKSTLLKLIDNFHEADSGDVTRQQGVKTALLDQEVPQDIQGSLFEVVARGFGDIGNAIAEYHRASIDAGANEDSGHFTRLEQLQDKLGAEGGWELLSQVERVLKMMGLDADVEFSVLSAGRKRRVMLARTLVTEPDVLLLDEPTNHLDIDAIRWLEEFLARIEITVVFVTHDRAFLRRLANRIVEIDRGKLFDWSCDYDTFLARKEALLADEEKHQALFEKRLAQEEAWIREGIKARRTRNEGRVRRLEAMRTEQQSFKRQIGKVRMQLQDAAKSGRLVIRAENLSFGYEEEMLVRDFSTMIMRGDRIGILGPNGIGKTTLIRLLLGDLTPASGTVKHGTKLEVAYFDQMRLKLDEQKTVKQNLAGDVDQVIQNGKPRHVYGYMQDFLFSPERARMQVKMLSGGERNRLLLAKLFLQPSNRLILDEPTNDLDAETLELLEEILLEFSGTLLIVSHDREFINNAATGVMVFEGDGMIGEYSGGYDDWFRQHEIAQAAAAQDQEKKSQPKPRPTAARTRKLTYKEQKELEALPAAIEALESEQAALHDHMAGPSFYQLDGEEIAAAKEELNGIETKLAQTYSRWEELESQGS